MFFVSAGLWLESHAFCFCRAVAGKPCVFFCLFAGGWNAICMVRRSLLNLLLFG